MKIAHYLLQTSAAMLLMACTSSKNAVQQKTDAISLEGTYWKLTELYGKPIVSGSNNKALFLTLEKSGLRVVGNGGCNGFGGSYELNQNKFNIKFTQLIRTQMACEDKEYMDQENNFLRAIEMADSYYINGDQLQLNKGRMAPLAIFKAQKSRPTDEQQ